MPPSLITPRVAAHLARLTPARMARYTWLIYGIDPAPAQIASMMRLFACEPDVYAELRWEFACYCAEQTARMCN